MSGVVAPWGRVTGRWLRADGTPAAGTVTLTPSPERVTASIDGGRIQVGGPVTVALDATGSVSLDVLAPGPGITPAGAWTYRCRVHLPGLLLWDGVVLVRQGETVSIVDVGAAEHMGDEPGGAWALIEAERRIAELTAEVEALREQVRRLTEQAAPLAPRIIRADDGRQTEAMSHPSEDGLRLRVEATPVSDGIVRIGA